MPASMPVRLGSTEPLTTPQRPGIRSARSLMATMQVEVPTMLTTSPRAAPAPRASQWASKAPTGIGMPGLRPMRSAHSGERVPAMCVGGGVGALQLCRRSHRAAGRRRSRKSSGGKPPSDSFHIHLWPIAQTLRVTLAGSLMPQSVAATMSQFSKRGGGLVAFVGIVAQPVEELGPAPFGGVGSSAPVDGGQVGFVARAAVISGGFLPGAVVAPEIVIADRVQVFVDGDYARAGGVDRYGFDVLAVDTGACDGCAAWR